LRSINHSTSDFDQKNQYPFCIPDSTFGVSLFWAEEYWAWNKIQKIRILYPNINLKGLLNIEFENMLPNLISKPPHHTLKGTTNYQDLHSDPWEIEYSFINLATSHAPSRIKAEKFLHEYHDNFIIINFDAHCDIGGNGIIHGAWLTGELLTKTVIIGGSSDSKYELFNLSNNPLIIENELEVLLDNSKFLNWIKEKKVYITFDLDFFKQNKKLEGFSNYWHRNFINGHSLNIFQEIELLLGQNQEIKNEPIGKSLGFFQNLTDYKSNKQVKIRMQAHLMIDLLRRLNEVLEENSASLLNLDIVEYSPLCDWHNLTINELIKSFNALNQVFI
jgi:hypothetical protein